MTKFIAMFYTMLAMLLIAVVSYSMQKSGENFSPPEYKIGVVLKAMDSEHWLSVRSGMTEAAQNNNMRLIVITAENETAFAEQIDTPHMEGFLIQRLLRNASYGAYDKISFDAEENSDIERLAIIGRKKLREDFFQAFDAGDADKLNDLARDADINTDFNTVSALMIIPKNFIDNENFLSAFAEMALNTCRNAAGEKIQPMIFISHNGGFFHWCLIVDSDATRAIAEQLQNFAKMYFNLELKIFLSPPEKNFVALSICWQEIYNTRADFFYYNENILSAENFSPLEIKIPDAVKIAGRELVEALSFTDEDFFSALKNFREKLYVGKIHPEILSAFLAELFASLENFLKELRGRRGKEYLPPAIRLALRYIEAHYREDISQTDVADAVHLNASYFSTLLKKSLDKGFSDYLTELRIEHVKEPLATTSEKIKTISTTEGFNDYQYFCKIFKRLTNLTPGKYREKFLR